jgi:hypothetical protein
MISGVSMRLLYLIFQHMLGLVLLLGRSSSTNCIEPLDRPLAATSWSGRCAASPGCTAICWRTTTGLLRVDHGAIKQEPHLDGK